MKDTILNPRKPECLYQRKLLGAGEGSAPLLCRGSQKELRKPTQSSAFSET
jgi:hypothetical protein